MIRIRQLTLPVSHTPEELQKRISKMLKIRPNQIHSYKIVRKSIDARNKKNLKYVYTIDISADEEKKRVQQISNKNILLTHEKIYEITVTGERSLKDPPVIAGSGPAGLFCGYLLAKAGYCPVILERGEEASRRMEKVENFWRSGILDPNSNVQFGEGGAGTFSDGKLNTTIKDPTGRHQKVLELFVEAGAPEEILYIQKPHLGTDMLVEIVQNMRNRIIDLGGTFRFLTQLTDFTVENNQLVSIEADHKEIIPAQVLVAAVGNSARDTFSLFHQKGIHMEPKPFAIGVRIEHPQAMINLSQYGMESVGQLGAASYKLTHQLPDHRGIYSFCMCPGGYVVNASSEENRLAVNGMSYYARAGKNANSALIVTVTPADFGSSDVLAGIEYQRRLEEKTYSVEDGKIPVQLFGDFKSGRNSRVLGEVEPQIKGAYKLSNLREILPSYLGDAIENGILAFDRKISGFAREDALLSGIESRTSSPVKILRNELYECNYKGIYPCGEGAGYAGGITSAAIDGLKVGEGILKKYRNLI